MPVNFQQAQQQIREMGQQARLRHNEIEARLDRARALLKQYADRGAELRDRAGQAALKNPMLRCALPCPAAAQQDPAPDSPNEDAPGGSSPCEPLNQSFPALSPAAPYVLLATDGSQINPDRHAPVQFAVVNVGAIRMLPGQGQAPKETVRSVLYFFQDQFAEGSLWTDDLVALMRDLAEREELAELAKKETSPVVGLTDGPLEMFRDPRDSAEFRAKLDDYRKVLEALSMLQVATAGYVDKPRSDLVVRLLELVELKDDQLAQAGKLRPLAGVFDTALFRDLLAPGERSAVFAIQSGFSSVFRDDFALHFFYFNAGRSGRPWIARVEIPRWVAENQSLTNLLHAALLAQCRQLGVKPYPYILHRSHEVAVVSFDEKEQLETMIAQELRRQGVEVEEQSYKQAAKESIPRTRYS